MESQYLINRRAIMLGQKPPEQKKQQKPIPKKSKKRIEQDKEYKRISKELIEKGKTKCAIKSPVCTGLAQGLDHAKGRVGKNLLDKKHLKPACNACNTYCSDNPQWAKDNCHSVSRLSN